MTQPWRIAAALLFAHAGFAQTTISLRTQGRDVDLSSATLTKPVRVGIVLPASCSDGELFFKSNAPQGTNLYGCAGGAWAVVGGSVTLSLAGDVSGTTGATVVSSLRGNPVAAATPADGDVLRWNATLGGWRPDLGLPLMANNANRLLSTDGTKGSWRSVGTGLTTDGASVSVDYSVVPGLSRGNTFTQPNAFQNGLTIAGGSSFADFSQAHTTAPVRVASSLPATCQAQNEMLIDTTDGHFYRCNAAGNGWVQLDGARLATAPVQYDSATQTVSCPSCETTSNKDQNGGYVGKDANGNVGLGSPLLPTGNPQGIVNAAGGFYENGAKIGSGVPYSGATDDVDLGAHKITAAGFQGIGGTPFYLEGAEQTQPAAPASGSQGCYFESGSHAFECQNSGGTVVGHLTTPAQIAQFRTVKVGGYEVGSENASAAFATGDLSAHGFAINDGNAKTLTEASCVSDAGSQSVTVKIGGTTLFTITCVPAASYSRSTTNGSTGYAVAASMGSTAVGAGAQLDLSGTANVTTKDIKLHIYGTVN
jgi:hypothetical protein